MTFETFESHLRKKFVENCEKTSGEIFSPVIVKIMKSGTHSTHLRGYFGGNVR